MESSNRSGVKRQTRSQRINGPLEMRFWAKVNKTPAHGCWEWTGSIRQGSGYGQIKNGMRMDYAHRTSWKLHNGEITPGLYVLHKCDNRICVNPDHLFLGTPKDNSQDMIKKGRQSAPRRIIVDGRVVCKYGHEKELLPKESDKYVCRICMNSWWKRDRKRFRATQKAYRKRRKLKCQ